MKKIICVCGPTASGKTALGVELALELGGEVVSADSMQIYRYMNIGTAKPDKEEMRGVVHHMLDVADPGEDYSVSLYSEAAVSCIEDIISRGKVPIVVGGTGLYYDSVLKTDGYAPRPNEALRQSLEEYALQNGDEALFERLEKTDPLAAQKLHVKDRKRVIRALEVFLTTGESIVVHNERSRALPPRYDALMIGLNFENRQALYSRIDKRVELMFEKGLKKEVEELLERGVPLKCTAMQAIGYKETAAHLMGECSLDEAVMNIQQSSRRYAKRQLTWFRKYEKMNWIMQPDVPDLGLLHRISTQYIRHFGI